MDNLIMDNLFKASPQPPEKSGQALSYGEGTGS